jgi:hypothetical protein
MPTWAWTLDLEVRAVQGNRWADWANLTPPAGQNEGGPRNSSESRQSRTSGAPILTHGHDGGSTGGCIPIQLIRPIPIILIAVHELREPKNFSDAPKQQLGHIVTDLSFTDERESGVRSQEEFIGQGTVTGRPPVILVEHTSEDNYVSQDAYDTVQSGRSSGESWCNKLHPSLFDPF